MIKRVERRGEARRDEGSLKGSTAWAITQDADYRVVAVW